MGCSNGNEVKRWEWGAVMGTGCSDNLERGKEWGALMAIGCSNGNGVLKKNMELAGGKWGAARGTGGRKGGGAVMGNGVQEGEWGAAMGMGGRRGNGGQRWDGAPGAVGGRGGTGHAGSPKGARNPNTAFGVPPPSCKDAVLMGSPR